MIPLGAMTSTGLRVTDVKDQLISLYGCFVTYTVNDKATSETVVNSVHHVGYKRAIQTVLGLQIGVCSFGAGHVDCVVFDCATDLGVDGTSQLALSTLDGDYAVVVRHGNACGDSDRLLSDS